MSDDIPDDDYGSAISRVTSSVAADTSAWDAAEMALIGAVLFVGGQVLLGNAAMIPVFAGLLGVWGVIAAVADTRVDERVAVRETGWRQETTVETTHVNGPQACAGHDHEAKDDIPCETNTNGRVVRSYDVLDVGGYEVYRNLNTEHVYCRNHYAFEYPAESDVDLDDILAEEADEDAEPTPEHTRDMEFRPASELHRR